MTIAIREDPQNMSPKDWGAHINTCQKNVIERLSADPAKAVTTLAMSGTVDDGLVCNVSQGKHSASMDMGRAMGGAARAPSPGFYGRAAIVGCIAIATKMTAVREGLSFRSVLVELEMDSDDLAIFGLGGKKAAPLETRIRILIDTDESAHLVTDMVDRLLEMDPWFLALRDAQKVSVGWEKPNDRRDHDRHG